MRMRAARWAAGKCFFVIVLGCLGLVLVFFVLGFRCKDREFLEIGFALGLLFFVVGLFLWIFLVRFGLFGEVSFYASDGGFGAVGDDEYHGVGVGFGLEDSYGGVLLAGGGDLGVAIGEELLGEFLA